MTPSPGSHRKNKRTSKKRRYRPTRANSDFSQGGDFTLQSNDGRQLRALQAKLSSASTVIADKIGTLNPGEALVLPHTRESLQLMLCFIYRRKRPEITSYDMLNEAMHMAEEYELQGMWETLRQELTELGMSYYADPLKALGLAMTHRLTEEANSSLERACQKHRCDNADDLLKVSQILPGSIACIRLFGTKLVKSNIISDVLFNFAEEPMKLRDHTFVCTWCRRNMRAPNRAGPLEWQSRWATSIFRKLVDHPMSTWKSYFSPAYLHQDVMPAGTVGTWGSCCCMERAKGKRYLPQFEEWLLGVHRHLLKRLEGVAELEQLAL